MFKWLFERVRVLYLCRKYGIENYTINKDNSIDVQGDLYLRDYRFEKLPIKFNIISGTFDCSHNRLTSFENFPKQVGRLCASDNKIESLVGLPLVVKSHFDIRPFINLSGNNIRTFEGCSNIYNFKTNNLSDGNINGITLSSNPISKVWSYILSGRKTGHNHLFTNEELNGLVDMINEYDFIRGDEIILDRFNEFLADVCRKGYTLHKHQFRIFKGYKIIK